MFRFIIYGIYAVSTSFITNQVKLSMKKQDVISVLIQLKPDDLQDNPKYKSGVSSEQEMNEYVSSLISKSKSHAQETSKNVRALLDEWVSRGIIIPYRYYFISNTFAAELSASLINILAKQPRVEEISSNNSVLKVRKFKSSTFKVVRWKGEEAHWSLKYINATNLPDHIYKAAANLRYGNADGGAQFNHPALASNYLGLKETGEIDHNYSWWDASSGEYNKFENICEPKSKIPCDDIGHGTHTLGTAVGGLKLGVSPTSKWMSCKNMYVGVGSPESYLDCLQFFLAPTDLKGQNPNPKLRPHVINNSYGCSEEGCSETTFNYALKNMKSAGIFMTTSVGNEGEDGCNSIYFPPVIDEDIFTVAATEFQSNERANFSSLGPIRGITREAVNISAPGVNITSSFINDLYLITEGTSSASPQVAGAVLLIIAACPHLDRQVDKIAQLLQVSATPILPKLKCGFDTATSVPNNEFGYGMLNVGRAIELCTNTSFTIPKYF